MRSLKRAVACALTACLVLAQLGPAAPAWGAARGSQARARPASIGVWQAPASTLRLGSGLVRLAPASSLAPSGIPGAAATTPAPGLPAAAALNPSSPAADAAAAPAIALPYAGRAAPVAKAVAALKELGRRLSFGAELDRGEAPDDDAKRGELTETFDHASRAAASQPEPAAPKDVAVVAVSRGRAPIVTTLAGLPAALSNAGFSPEEFNRNGHLRLVFGERNPDARQLTEADSPAIEAALARLGLEVDAKRRRSVRIPVSWGLTPAENRAPEAAAPAAAGSRWKRWAIAAGAAGLHLAFFGVGSWIAAIMLAAFLSNADRLAREFAYAGRTLKAAFADSGRPTWNEVLLGVVGKVLPAFVNIGIFAAAYKGHPVAMALVTVLTLAQEVFHGIFSDTWNNLQAKIGAHRGAAYQNFFNLFYGQLTSGIFRAIAFFTLANISAPWSLDYWKAIAAMTVIGTFFGTLGYRGLNSLYEKGRIPRWGRSTIQQVRDLFLMTVGPFFSTNNMFMTWLVFGAMQLLDLIISIVDRRASTRPILYVADQDVARSKEFAASFIQKSSPLQEALNGLRGSFVVKPFVAFWGWARKRLNRERVPRG